MILNQWELKAKTGSLLEVGENASDQVWVGLVSYLIGWDVGASFRPVTEQGK